ncbi:transposable element Tcb1 transposase [Trichonephila clavipes]|nr:transposable element Tcb1 transposase [Trichonephila clavipes]
MFDPSSFANPTPLAHADTSRDVLPRGGTSQWDMLGRRIAARQPPPTCLPELRRALLDEWCNIRQDQINNLILSMPRRCQACIASSGRHTPY